MANRQIKVLLLTLAIAILKGCASSRTNKDDGIEILNIHQGRYKVVKLILIDDDLYSKLGQPTTIDSLQLFGKDEGKYLVTSFFKVDSGSISFIIKKDTAVLNGFWNNNNNAKLVFPNICLTKETNLLDIKEVFPKTYEQYVTNNEGKFSSYEDKKVVDFKHKILIKSSNGIDKYDFFELEFNSEGRLVNVLYFEK